MTEVEKMEKQLLQLETFWELHTLIVASTGTDLESLDACNWMGLYTLASKNPQVKAHLKGLVIAAAEREAWPKGEITWT